MINRKMDQKFELVSKYQPTGDQPQAIKKLTAGVKAGKKSQILLGATGTGKTFTISNVIKNVNKPTLVLSHNKTLVGQLYGEFKEFFPNNAVEYFVSFYDYYQPEAYIPSNDTYIEKDSSINDEIDKLRHSATNSLIERNDVIIVASVSAIFGLGDPTQYRNHVVSLCVGQEIDRNELVRKLVDIQFQRNDIDFQRKRFRVHGDIIEIFPASHDGLVFRVEFFGDEIDRIQEVSALNGKIMGDRDHIVIFPATHFMTNDDVMARSIDSIHSELIDQLRYLESEGKLLEAQRLKQRTEYDIEMIKEMGYTNGIENYSRFMDGRQPGETPHTLLDFFPKDFLLVVDESHMTIPQIRGMYNGDRSRKQQLIDYGFRLPSALDNRPLQFSEFENHVGQVIYMSATPGDYELEQTKNIVEQIIRPTGLMDPTVEVHPIIGQMDDLVGEINNRIDVNERVLVTTLTKKMAEDLTDYLKNIGIKVAYLHSEIKTLDRMIIIRDIRLGKYDVLIGINLLREGIDIPEVSLVIILDADKEGFLRNVRSLIQTIGRAARNEHGSVIMYADTITDSMKRAMYETSRRREIQDIYNKTNGITPKTIIKPVRNLISMTKISDVPIKKDNFVENKFQTLSKIDQEKIINRLEKEMRTAAKNLDFENASSLRDTIIELKTEMNS